MKKYPPPNPPTRTQWLFGFRSLVENQISLLTWIMWATSSKCLDIFPNQDIFGSRWIRGRLTLVSHPTPFDPPAVKLNGVCACPTFLPYIAFFLCCFLIFYPPNFDTRYCVLVQSGFGLVPQQILNSDAIVPFHARGGDEWREELTGSGGACEGR